MPNTKGPTPSKAIGKVLRSFGLKQGQGTDNLHRVPQDFKVQGIYDKGRRVGTIAYALNPAAEELMGIRANDIEYLTRELGFPFAVLVRHFGGAVPSVSISNMSIDPRSRGEQGHAAKGS